MAPTRAADFYVDSDDDELPTLNTLLTRPSNRALPKYSQPRLIPSLEKSSTTTIKSGERLNDLDVQKPEVIDLISDSEDTIPKRATPAFTRKETRKKWRSSLDQVDQGIFDEEIAPQLKGSLINSQKSGKRENGLQSRLKEKQSDDLASRKESTKPVRSLREPSDLPDESLFTKKARSKTPFSNSTNSASRLPRSRALINNELSDAGQEEPLTQHPRNRSLRRLQTVESNSPRQSSENKGRQDIIRPFSHLQLDLEEFLERDALRSLPITSPGKDKQKNLVLPDEGFHIKIPRELDFGIARELESDDDLYEPHTPRKIIPAQSKVPKTTSPKKQNKKSFDAKKGQLAADFLRQLDAQITDGKIGELTESTGGVKIVWSKTLKTTAGRASWKRETVSSKQTKDGVSVDVKQYRHHSSIELAEKVIDDEQRLLNVIAHEFCHLANFMINGIKDNPHGKEFKVWAAKCSKVFGSQGIKVTTKHTYEIDFKYVWTCTECGCEYKRHSKSIDPNRHRCGSCKALLEQTKPTPRQASTAGKLSDYQLFVKEQMKIVRNENPDSQQKDVMKIIADKWAKTKN
ncbi:SprT-like family domain-containing protein [Trichoderma evansii]